MAYGNISGNVRLGHTWVSGQQPGALGEEFTIVSADYDPADDVYVNNNASPVRVKLLRNTSGGTLVPGTTVKRDASGNMSYDVVQAVATNVGCAIIDPSIQGTVPDDGIFLGIIYGETDIKCGATQLAKGATVQPTAAGVAIVADVTVLAQVVSAFGVALEIIPIGALGKAFVNFPPYK